jgi:hypothetical protein
MQMRSYLQSLHKHVEQVNQEREQAKQQEAVTPPPAKPLERQLIELFRTVSEEQMSRPWTMDEITLQCRGKYRRHPHPQQVATELRKMGWQSRRVYGTQAAGRRYWFPPA